MIMVVMMRMMIIVRAQTVKKLDMDIIEDMGIYMIIQMNMIVAMMIMTMIVCAECAQCIDISSQ